MNHTRPTITEHRPGCQRHDCKGCGQFGTQTEYLKTLKDCAACEVHAQCDAHISGGSWKHREGPDPCRVVE